MRTGHSGELDEAPVPVRVKLAIAWTTFMFLYVYVDILGLYFPGTVEDILDGVVFAFAITQAWAIGALVLMAVPILMIVLTTTLKAGVSRMVNLGVASLYTTVSVGNAVGESWTYFFTLATGLEVAILAVIFRYAWAWPRASAATRTSASPLDHAHGC
jgi:hypothetical protein